MVQKDASAIQEISDKDLLRVSRLDNGDPEIFQSIQGEGVNLGSPCTFLRLAGCNLKCTWCDTKYTWDWDKYKFEDEVVQISVKNLICKIKSLHQQHLVITGGEPLLQQKILANLTSHLSQIGFFIEVETNGTILPTEPFASTINQWNISPKLSNSENGALEGYSLDTLHAFTAYERSYLKFVLKDPGDCVEVVNIVNELAITPRRVYLMPEGTTKEEISRKSTWISELCLVYGYNFTTRAHILIWGDKRGK